MHKVDQLFIETVRGFRLNTELNLQFTNEQEAAQYLVQAIRFWRGKVQLFCEDHTSVRIRVTMDTIALPEGEWCFAYKTPSNHGNCVNAQRLLDTVFGDRKKFNALPFVTDGGDRQYNLRFDLLLYFAQHGHENTMQLIALRKQEAESKRLNAEEKDLRDGIRVLEEKLRQLRN